MSESPLLFFKVNKISINMVPQHMKDNHHTGC